MVDVVRNIIGLDVGQVRTGVAVASSIARIARPFTTIETEQFDSKFSDIMAELSAKTVIVGLPRTLAGEDSAQTAFVRQFTEDKLQDYDIVFMDEALTSQKAEQELITRKKPFKKAEIDALAATYILQDFLDQKEAGEK